MLRRCLGPVAVTAQAVGTVELTLTAVFNIPEAMRSAGSATWISYGLARRAVFPHTMLFAESVSALTILSLNTAVVAMAVAYLSGAFGKQNSRLLTFSGLLLVGVLRAWSAPLEPKRLM